MHNYYSSTIQKGSKGDDVLAWQKFLNQDGWGLAEDGVFGEDTYDATMDYQSRYGLLQDGVVGAQTWAHAGFTPLSGSAFGSSSPSGNSSSSGSSSSGSSTSGNSSTSKPPSYTPTDDGWTYDKFDYDKYTELSKEGYDFNTPYTELSKDGYDFNTSYTELSKDGYDFNKEYSESTDVTKAGEALGKHIQNNNPGDYTSKWQTQLDGLMNKIMNREKFSYNFNEDALYQQYKDKYVQQGKMAMGDTMGQAAAMTGGYGNSYAQSVGQQAYQQSLDNLNDIVPELYQMALDKYKREGQDLYNQYGLIMDREDMDYGRHRDELSDFFTERDYLQGRYDTERELDYSKYVDDRNFEYNRYENDRNFDYNQYVNDRNFEYNRYESDRTHDYNKYVSDRNFEYNRYESDRTHDYNKYVSDRNLAYDEYATDKNLSYQDYRNQIADEQWQKEYETQQNPQQDPQQDPVVVPGPVVDPGGNTPATIPDEYKQKATTFKNNDDLADWAYGLADTGAITNEQARELIENNMDRNEKYNEIKDRTGTVRERTASYSKMLDSFDGWEMVTKGGVNLFGIDKDAYVRAPNGKEYSLAELKKILIDEGMDSSVAQKKLKGLQQKLGISSNWLFGW